MSTKDKAVTALKVLVPLVIIGLGIGVVVAFAKTKPEPERQDDGPQGLLVETTPVHAGDHEVEVEARGQVTAAKRVTLSPQVPGRVTWVSEDLVPGGRLTEGQRLVRLDARDYRLALRSRNAEVNRAELELQLEQRRQAVAEREWELFDDEAEERTRATGGASDEGRALALRQPQLETAEVGVEAAESALQRARLDLSRTGISAPFNAVVLNEQVDVGQYVAPGAQLGTLVGTDEAWVQVSVPVEALGSIQLPSRDGEGSEAEIRFDVGGKAIVRHGRVLRLLPDLDPSGGTARLLVSIPDPFSLAQDAEGSQLPMLLGSYVTVAIGAETLEDVVEVPRLAVREGDQVYVMNDESKLEVRTIRVAWGREDTVLVREGLSDGDRVITSRVPTPVEGLPLRVAEPETAEPEAPVSTAAVTDSSAAEATR